MPQQAFIGPLLSDVFGGRGGRNIRERDGSAERLRRENEAGPLGAPSDVGANTGRIASMEKRLAEIERIQKAYEARRQTGKRVRKPSAKIEREAESLRERIASSKKAAERNAQYNARVNRAKAARKAKKPGNVAGAVEKATSAAGGKKRKPRTAEQKAARNAREREARAAKKAGG